ncbi:3346_t:CDS:2, partial [Acaulospora colombiana]
LVEASQAFVVGDRRIILLDTPGFDNTAMMLSDGDISEAVVEYMKAGRGDRKLYGIIYLQNVDERRPREAETLLKPFEELCDNVSPRRVALVTTMWESDHLRVGEAREKELKEREEFWAPALKRGAKLHRHDGTKESAENILLSLFSTQDTAQPTQDYRLIA